MSTLYDNLPIQRRDFSVANLNILSPYQIGTIHFSCVSILPQEGSCTACKGVLSREDRQACVLITAIESNA